MQKASLVEPLLQKAVMSEAVAGPTLELSVLRRGCSQLTVRSAEGDVRFLVHRRSHSLFGGLDWHLVNAVGDEDSNLLVRRSLASGQTTFCTAHDDLTPAMMTHKLGQLFSDLHWGSSIYRWEVMGPCAPVLLRLVNTATRQCVAQLQASTSLPWSKKQQKITVYADLKDSLWLQVVVASGLAEAQRLGIGNSWTVPKRWAK